MTDLKKFIVIVMAAVVAATSLLGGWWIFFAPSGKNGLDFEPFTVEAETVRRGAIIRRITVVGTLRADNEVVIKPEIEGKIKKINFQGGNFVETGDPLVEIDPELYAARLKEAKATLEFATAEAARYASLAAQSAGSTRNKEKAEAEKLQAEARLEQAQLQFDNTTIKAPFSGIVGLKQYSVGGFVDPRTELLTIVDVDPIKVDFRVPATYLKSISVGQDVTVNVDSFPDEDFKAKIDAIDAKVDQAANSVLVRGIIPNPRGRLKPGLFARVNLVVGSKENVLLVPETSVLSKANDEYAFRVVEAPVQGVLQTFALRVPVTTGLSEGGVTEIVRGLSEGDVIITIGLSKVRDQFPVTVVDDVEAEEAFKESGIKPDEEIKGGDDKKGKPEAAAEKPKDEASEAQPTEAPVAPKTPEEPVKKDDIQQAPTPDSEKKSEPIVGDATKPTDTPKSESEKGE